MTGAVSTRVRADGSRLRVLAFSSLYPSAARPRHGIFVETRLREICATGNVDLRVVAPLPWFPLRSPLFGRYAALAKTPIRSERFGINVMYPRYPMLPRLGVRLQPHAMAAAGLRAIGTLYREGFDFDVIDAHYFYPDGVAAGLVSRWTGKPFVVTARGSDLNLIADDRQARERIVDTASRAQRVLCVSAALRARAIEIGIPEAQTEVARNGVNTELFRICDRDQSRRRLGMRGAQGPLLLCVGNLVPEKGHEVAIDTLCELGDCTLLLIGEGPLRQHLAEHAARRRVANRVSFMPSMPQEDLVTAYNAADVLVHPSEREGWPNVVLEAIACGTPAVATDVGGVREIMGDGAPGRVVESRSPSALAAAVRSLLGAPPERSAVRQYAMSFGWASVAQQCLQALQRAASTATRVSERNPRCAT